MKKLLAALALLLLLVVVSVAVWYNCFLNRYQIDGELALPGFDAEVEIYRDSYGTPYVFAGDVPDMIRGFGFVTAQDRILQAELSRRLVSGRMAEVLGPSLLNSDIRARVSGYYRAAQRHEPKLSEASRAFLQWYVDGVNAFIAAGQKDYPLELELLGLLPLEPWTVGDALAMLYFGSSIHGRNISAELLSQAILHELGPEALRHLRPLDSNPERDGPALKPGWEQVQEGALSFGGLEPWPAQAPPLFGSNNWAIAPSRSASGRALLTNDPHLDASQLPGYLYPVALFSPQVNVVGLGMAGVAGVLIGRTDHVAFGVTNGYGDSQDTYLESQDPADSGRYLEGEVSLPFEVRTETVRVKQGDQIEEHELTIRSTRRGPVISDHEVFGVESADPISARWAVMEHQSPEIGLDRLLTATNADEFDLAVGAIDLLYFNFVFADSAGGIGHRSSGLVPVRRRGGAEPTAAATGDNWIGFIPKMQMPGDRDPEKGWVGTANHDTRGDDYPFYYGSSFAPDYRYRRMMQLLSGDHLISAEGSWRMTLDTYNLLGEELAPLFARWLAAAPATEELAALLASWDYQDSSDSVGAAVFHTIYEEAARLSFEDEMSPRLLEQFLRSRYYWQPRYDRDLLSGGTGWFDDRRTPEVETAADIVLRAGERAGALLSKNLGQDTSQWQWGRVMRLVFVSPLRRSGPGRDLLGGGEYAGRGSWESLNRGVYSSDSFPYRARSIAAARIVADFADDEKIMAVLPAGSVARQGHPWMTSQLASYVSGDWIPYWRDRDKVLEHAEHRLLIRPGR